MEGYGLIVVIQYAGGLATAYAHSSSLGVSTGQTVGQGQRILVGGLYRPLLRAASAL